MSAAFRRVAVLARRLSTAIFRTQTEVIARTDRGRLVRYRTVVPGIRLAYTHTKLEKYRVALLIDEFFGALNTPIGGFGSLARKYICRHVPDETMEIVVILGIHDGREVLADTVDGTTIYRLPIDISERRRWLDAQRFDAFMSIEMTYPSFVVFSQYLSNAPLLFYVRDPRDLAMYQPRLRTVDKIRDGDWSFIEDIARLISDLIAAQRIVFVSQGEELSQIARRAYRLPDSVPIREVPSAVEIDHTYRLDEERDARSVVFIGRLEAQKRAWIVCEIAKAMPHCEFYIIGTTGTGRDEQANAETLAPYRHPDGSSKLANLHFLGHLDGEEKNRYLTRAKLLLNVSIWEGIPGTWLEALSYGTLIVSAFDRDRIVARFGTFVGEIMGDGTDETSIGKFVAAIDGWLTDDDHRKSVARDAIGFIKSRHSLPPFVRTLRAELRQICMQPRP